MNWLKELDPLRDDANNEQGTVFEYIAYYGLVVSCIVGSIFTLLQF